jgi:hypothetical protein
MTTLKLRADNFEITFNLDYLEISQDVNCDIQLEIIGNEVAQIIKGRTNTMLLMELSELKNELSAFLQQPMPGPLKAANLFIPYQLGFQFHALRGDTWEFTEANHTELIGSFTLRFMLNFSDYNSGSTLYCGVEGTVELEQAKLFLLELSAFIDRCTSTRKNSL